MGKGALEREFAEFLNIIEEFKSSRCLAGALYCFAACLRLRPHPPTVPHSAPSASRIVPLPAPYQTLDESRLSTREVTRVKKILSSKAKKI